MADKKKPPPKLAPRLTDTQLDAMMAAALRRIDPKIWREFFDDEQDLLKAVRQEMREALIRLASAGVASGRE